MTAVIKLEDVNKVFNQGTPDAFNALSSINLEINTGDFITIVGGNGAGKSTLLNAIAGAFPIDSGKVILKDQDITAKNDIDRAQYISRVFQDPKTGTAPRMTVEENLSLAERRGQKRGLKFALTDGQRHHYKEELAPLGLGLEKRLNAEIGLLSGGQRQAVALLMATIREPEILLLDEHTAALDPKTSRRILELTEKQVVDNHLTAMMITHNLSDAIQYGNRMLVLHHGEIVHDFNQAEKAAFTTADLYALMEGLEEMDA